MPGKFRAQNDRGMLVFADRDAPFGSPPGFSSISKIGESGLPAVPVWPILVHSLPAKPAQPKSHRFHHGTAYRHCSYARCTISDHVQPQTRLCGFSRIPARQGLTAQPPFPKLGISLWRGNQRQPDQTEIATLRSYCLVRLYNSTSKAGPAKDQPLSFGGCTEV